MVGTTRVPQTRSNVRSDIQQGITESSSRIKKVFMAPISAAKGGAKKAITAMKATPKVILRSPINIARLCFSLLKFGYSTSLSEAACLVKQAACGNGASEDCMAAHDPEGLIGEGRCSAKTLMSKLKSLLSRAHSTTKAILFLVSVVLAKVASIVGLLVSLPVIFILGIILLCTFIVLVFVRALKGTGTVKANLEMGMSFPKKIISLFTDRMMSDLKISKLFMFALFAGSVDEMFASVEFVDPATGTIYVHADSNTLSVMLEKITSIFEESKGNGAAAGLDHVVR